MAKREENLAKNTVLFAIGNLGSKLLQIVLVPFYTRFMSDTQYGTVDLLQSMASLLMPIFSLTIAEGVFRYAMDKDYDKSTVLSVGIVVTAIGSMILCFGGWGVSCSMDVTLVWLVVANTITNSFRTLTSQYTRAIGKTGLYALDNILMTACVLLFNIFFIAKLNWGVTGYMLGYTLANLFSAVFLIVKLGNCFTFHPHKVHKPLVKEMLLFSLPLIPNSICWWISSFLDRVMIVSMVSTAANGLYAAAHKIPSLLSMVMTIFFQAWQVSANEEFKKKDITQFYTKIFEQIYACILVMASLLIMLSKPINSVFLGADYYEAWKLMPPLILSTTFYSFAQFLGSIYTANKKTKMAFVTNLVGVAVSVSLNLILIPSIGTIGAAVANATSYLVLWTVRIWNTRKIIPIQYQTTKIVAAFVIVVLEAVLVVLDLNAIATYSICAVGSCALVVLFWNSLVALVKFVLRFAGKLLRRES